MPCIACLESLHTRLVYCCCEYAKSLASERRRSNSPSSAIKSQLEPTNSHLASTGSTHDRHAMAAKSFDSATYLRGLGWQGPGSSLNNSANGRAKPVTVVQKKTLAGIGRDRDTSFAWWDAVFSSVANKVGSTQVRHSLLLASSLAPD